MRPEDMLFPEGPASAMEMDRAWIQNGPKLRNHRGLTEPETADLKKAHLTALNGVVRSIDIADVHTALTNRLVRPALTESDIAEENKRAEADRKKFLEQAHTQYGDFFDLVFAKAKQMLASRPALVKLMQEARADNDVTLWNAVLKQAKLELKKERKV